MNKLNNLKGESLIFRIQILFSILFLYFTFFFDNKYYLPIKDYFEGEYTKKLIKSDHFNFFNLDYLVPNFLGGLKYNYLPPSEFNLSTLIELLLPLKNAVLIIDIVSYIIFFIFTYKICRLFNINKPSSATAASFAGFSGYYPTYSLTMIGLIIILYLFLKTIVTKNNLKKYEIFTLIISPIFHEIQFGGIWIVFIGLITIFKLNKSRLVKNFYALIHLIFLFLINYRLIYEIFFGVETNRSVFITKIIQFDKFSVFLEDLFLSNFYGYWQILIAPKYYLGLFLFFGFLYMILKIILKRELNDKQKLFLQIYMLVQLINIIFALSHSTFLNIDALLGVRVKFFRIILFNQLMMPLALGILLNQFKKLILVIPFFFISFMVNDSALWKLTNPSSFDNLNNNIKSLTINFGQKANYIDYVVMNSYIKIFSDYPTYHSFYSVEEDYFRTEDFNNLKNQLEEPLSNYRVVSYDIDPMIAGFNNFYILDGYFSIYSDAYREKFRNIIEKELDYQGDRSVFLFDNHPQRLYLFDNDRYPSMDLDNINFCALHQVEATHLISQKQVQYNLLKLEKKSNNLFLYKIIFEDC
tara:strand:- start:1120 stop:2868 length:1749 start_codon:yes stop_codon:yes gene_type:complete